jgi:hypothetical protein
MGPISAVSGLLAGALAASGVVVTVAPPSAGSLAGTSVAAAAARVCTRPVFATRSPNGGWSTAGYYVYNNMWNNSSGGQALHACAYNNWHVTARQPHTTSVKTYPNVHKDSPNTRISSLRRLTSTFGAATPHLGIYNAAYDIWLNGIATSRSTEVMIWTENWRQRPAGRVQAVVTISGRVFDVWRSGTQYIAFVPRRPLIRGTVNLLLHLRWLQAKRWISSTATIGQIGFGVEICSTNNYQRVFRIQEFGIIRR